MEKLAIVLLSLPLMAMAATEKIDGIEWSYTVSGGKASVGSDMTKGASRECAAIPPATAGAISVPSTLGGFSVTTIGEKAFYFCKALTSVKIPGSVTTIGRSAFCNCESLASVTIPNGVTTIGDYAFSDCGALTSVTIPKGVTTIGKAAFSWCKALKSVTIPNGVTTIGEKAFENCDALTSVKIPDSVTTIGKSAFEGCDALTSVTIPKRVTTIGEAAFSWCKALKSVTIQNGVTTIGEKAFIGCKSLVSMEIPDSVIKINDRAFSDCDVSVFRVSSNNPAYRVIDDCLVSKDGKTLVRSVAKSCGVIPNGVKIIGVGAFEGCEALTSVTIPKGVTIIGKDAFRGCGALKSVTIPNGVTTIGEEAFSWCKALKSVTIPNGVTTIGEEAFKNCDVLASVKIPDSVTTIGSDAFSGCKSLNDVYCSDVQRESLVAGGVNIIGMCRKDLTKLFGAEFGAKKAKYITSFYNIGEIPAYDYRPEKSFLNFDTYSVMFDLNDEVFFIRAMKDCETLDDLVLLEIKVISAIERKFGAKMQTHGLTESYADITYLYHDLMFQNRKQICVRRAAVNNRGYRLIVYGVDPVVWNAIDEIKRRVPDMDDSL